MGAVHHATMAGVLRVGALAIAPVKGMRTVAVDALELAESGPVGDRAFHLREADGAIALTKRYPRLVQVVPAWDGEELALAFPDGSRVAAAGGARRGGVDHVLRRARRCPGRAGRRALRRRAVAVPRAPGRARRPRRRRDRRRRPRRHADVRRLAGRRLGGPRRRGGRPAALSDDDRDRRRAGVGGGRLGRARGGRSARPPCASRCPPSAAW